MPAKLLTSGGGGVILQPASSIASDVTVNVPSASGTLVSTGATGQVTQSMLAANVVGNGPTVHAYQSGTAQTISNNTDTKVVLNTENFDTNNNFDSTTNYRFTPTIAGYYQLYAQVTVGVGGAPSNAFHNCYIYKNGVAWFQSASAQPNNGNYASAYCNGLMYFNGTTDYVEIYTAHANFVTNPVSVIGGQWTYFTAFLARAA